MKIYFMKFRVIPNKANEYFDQVKGAIAHCWTMDNDPKSARAKAVFNILKGDWEITNLESPPIEVVEEQFTDRELGIEQYHKAKKEGIAIYYVAWSRDGKTATGPIAVKPSRKFILSEFINDHKRLSQKGRCLHFDRGVQCNEIIRAHSIQKSRSLAAIAENGHVYGIAYGVGSLKKNKGRFVYDKVGINKVSTFLGFCKRHDSELFECIDKFPLIPTAHQVFLYSYRSLCRELFVLENALELAKNQLEQGVQNRASNMMFSGFVHAKKFGLKNLERQKEYYDNSLKMNSYTDIRYVLFISKKEPTLAFSGLIYPDFDFMAEPYRIWGISQPICNY